MATLMSSINLIVLIQIPLTAFSAASARPSRYLSAKSEKDLEVQQQKQLK